MSCATKQLGSKIFMALKGNILEEGATKLKQEFNALSFDGINALEIDLSEVGFIGSSGIGKLLLVYKRLAYTGGTIRLVGTPQPIAELFRELQLDTMFEMEGGSTPLAGSSGSKHAVIEAG